jgi:hypothetical protein
VLCRLHPEVVIAGDTAMVLGGANCVPLKMLKNSVRNSRSSRSLAANLVLLNREESKLSTPYERSRGSTRGSFPNVKSGGAVKQKELNHRGAFRLFGFPSFAVAAPDTDVRQPDKVRARTTSKKGRAVKPSVHKAQRESPLENSDAVNALSCPYQKLGWPTMREIICAQSPDVPDQTSGGRASFHNKVNFA